MTTQIDTDYYRIEKAINYLRSNFKAQPSLEEVAEKIHMSPFHFQRLFTAWAGVSPKKFLQYISIEYAKSLLLQNNRCLADTAFETGLSGSSRLHDLFVKIEGMTPGEYKNGGHGLTIKYRFADTAFGHVLIGNTTKGICHIAFAGSLQTALPLLQSRFPNARYIAADDPMQEQALQLFNSMPQCDGALKLHVKGTAFQLKVWASLLSITPGTLSTYNAVAQNIQHPTASRAVGSAIGANPIAFLIPCHRVIRSSGVFGEYMWGSDRKTAIIGWEAARVNQNQLGASAVLSRETLFPRH